MKRVIFIITVFLFIVSCSKEEFAPETALFTINNGYSHYANIEVGFSGESRYNQSPVNHTWNYGDGTIEKVDSYYAYHTYTRSGKFTVTHTVSNPKGSKSFTQEIDIL